MANARIHNLNNLKKKEEEIIIKEEEFFPSFPFFFISRRFSV